MAKQKENTTKEQVGEQNRLNESLQSAVGILNEIRTLNKESLNTYADQVSLSKQLYENANLIATANKAIDHHLSVASDNYGIVAKRAELIASQTEIHRDLTQEISQTFAELVKNSETIADSEFERVDLSKLQNKLIEERYNLELGREVLGKREYERESASLDILQEKINAMREMNAAQSRANELSQKFLGNTKLTGFAFNTMLGKIEHFVDEVSGEGLVGKFLGKKASAMLEHTKEDIQQKVVAAFQESGNAGVTAFSVTKMAAGSFVKYALPALGIAGLLGIFYGIIHAVGHLDEELKEIGHQFGVSRKEADKIHHLTLDIAKEMNLVGINSKEVAEGLAETAGIMNGLNLVPMLKAGNEAAMQLVKDVTVLTEKLHVSADEAKNIQMLSVMTGKPMGKLVKEAIGMGKGILTSKQSLAIIGKISPGIALNFKKGSTELLKAAQRAKLLGMELKDVQDFGEGILDFESSLEKEMEARVLTGKNINFDLARQYALNNDIAGLQGEMLNQLGSLNEFQNMNFLQRKSIAAAFGMEVDQIAELLTNQEKLNQLGLTQQKLSDLQASNAEKLRKEAQKMSDGKLKDYIMTLAKEKEVATINDRIADAVKKIKEVLASTLAPLLEQAHAFLDSAEGAEFVKGTIEGIKGILTGIAYLVKGFASGIASINKLFGGTGTAVALIAGTLGLIATYFVGKAILVKGVQALIGKLVAAKGAAAGLSTTMQGVSSAAGGGSAAAGQLTSLGTGVSSFTKNAVGGAIAMLAIAGALWILSKALQEFSNVKLEDMGKALLALTGLVGAVYLLSKIQKDAIAGAAALAILGGALYVIGYALKAFEDISWESLGKAGVAIVALTGAVFGLGAILATGIAAIIFGAGIAGFIALGGALGVLGIGLHAFSKAMKSLIELGDVKKAGENLSSGLTKLSSSVKSIDTKSFERFQAALYKLNLDKIIKFGELAKTDLSKAGDNIKAGIESLAKVTGGMDFGEAGWFVKDTGIAGTLASFNDVMGELDLDGIKAFAELASADLSKIGEKINSAIQSMKTNIIIDAETISKLQNLGQLFLNLNNAISVLNYEKIKEFSSVNLNGMITFSTKFGQFINEMSIAGTKAGKVLQYMNYHFQLLNDAIDQLDIDKLNKFASVKAENFKKIASVFQEPQSVTVTGGGGGGTTTGGGETSESRLNKKFDQMIDLLGKLVEGSNQPTVIKFGDRTIETIMNESERRRQQNTTRSGGRSIDFSPAKG